MWKLDDISDKDLSQYKRKMLNKVKDRLANPPKYPYEEDGEYETRIKVCKSLLSDRNLKKLFVSKPKDLESHNNYMMKKVFSNYEKDILRYIELKQKDKKNEKEKLEYATLLKQFRLFNRDLVWLMGFDDIVTGDKEFSYWLCKIKGADTCTYCNRQYTFTIGNKTSGYVVRPHLDHWRPKSLFPLMSLSFYNLIPSCPNCNTSSKGATVFSLDTHIHPYTQKSQDPDFSFHALPNAGGGWKLELWTDGDIKVENTIDAFKLKEIYSMHNTLEVNDIMSLIVHNGNTYLNILLENILSNFVSISREDAIRMLLGFESNEEKLDKRPLSKMKRDLLKNVGIL